MGLAKILVVDDDADVRRMLAEYLGTHGYDVETVGDGAAMQASIDRARPHLVLLDLGLPGEDGISLARQLRARSDIGIIMVTASAEPVDRIVGLEVGADDYIAKPFDPRELRARIRSVLRRVQAAASTGGAAGQDGAATTASAPGTTASAPAAANRRIPIGRCMLDVPARLLFDRDGGEVPLTAMEFDLLKAFIDHPNQVLSRDRLLTLSRDRSWEPFDRSIDIRITRLRRKIEDDPENPRAIRTVRGAGYMYVPAATAA
jgi:two-component system phosphate regulon response regulator OmpR